MSVHPNITRERQIAKLLDDAQCLDGEARSLRRRATYLESQEAQARHRIEQIEDAPLLPLTDADGLTHRIQTEICPGCGLADAGGHYNCHGAIPVPVVLYLPDVRGLLTPFKNPSIIPYQGGFQAVLRVDSVQPGRRRDAVREFGPESQWRQPDFSV